jgi:hypothetical protein
MTDQQCRDLVGTLVNQHNRQEARVCVLERRVSELENIFRKIGAGRITELYALLDRTEPGSEESNRISEKILDAMGENEE